MSDLVLLVLGLTFGFVLGRAVLAWIDDAPRRKLDRRRRWAFARLRANSLRVQGVYKTTRT